MNAIKFLKKQHREVKALFRDFEKTDDDRRKAKLFGEIADALTIHATIEERHFYPAVREKKTEDQVEEAYEEHLGMKKLLVEARDKIGDPGFDGIVAAIIGAVEHHVEEEEGELFPKVEKLFDEDTLEEIGERLEADAGEMESEDDPSSHLEVKTEPPAAPGP